MLKFFSTAQPCRYLHAETKHTFFQNKEAAEMRRLKISVTLNKINEVVTGIRPIRKDEMAVKLLQTSSPKVISKRAKNYNESYQPVAKSFFKVNKGKGRKN